jgi:hypothetical protein
VAPVSPGPVGPVGPVSPVSPVFPCIPCSPVGPSGPGVESVVITLLEPRLPPSMVVSISPVSLVPYRSNARRSVKFELYAELRVNKNVSCVGFEKLVEVIAGLVSDGLDVNSKIVPELSYTCILAVSVVVPISCSTYANTVKIIIPSGITTTFGSFSEVMNFIRADVSVVDVPFALVDVKFGVTDSK